MIHTAAHANDSTCSLHSVVCLVSLAMLSMWHLHFGSIPTTHNTAYSIVCDNVYPAYGKLLNDAYHSPLYHTAIGTLGFSTQELSAAFSQASAAAAAESQPAISKPLSPSKPPFQPPSAPLAPSPAASSAVAAPLPALPSASASGHLLQAVSQPQSLSQPQALSQSQPPGQTQSQSQSQPRLPGLSHVSAQLQSKQLASNQAQSQMPAMPKAQTVGHRAALPAGASPLGSRALPGSVPSPVRPHALPLPAGSSSFAITHIEAASMSVLQVWSALWVQALSARQSLACSVAAHRVPHGIDTEVLPAICIARRAPCPLQKHCICGSKSHLLMLIHSNELKPKPNIGMPQMAHLPSSDQTLLV